MNQIKFLIAGFALLIVISASIPLQQRAQIQQSHRLKSSALPMGYNDYFAASGECASCHNSQTLPSGQSVALADSWRSTMMANAAKDPLWQAKVSAEVDANPAFKAIIEQKCTSCHAAAGNFNAMMTGSGSYGMDQLAGDPFGQDGVQCTVCHQIPSGSMGNHSGHFQIGDQKTIWGPFTNPMAMPMFNFTGYTPEHSNHIRSSALCGSCHTLLTQAILEDGSLSQTYFVEQSVYQEWQNSIYARDGVSCQTCHMPLVEGPVKISDRPPFLEARSTFSQHQFVGANLFMNQVLTDHLPDLSLSAEAIHFDSTRVRTQRMLQEQTLELNIELIEHSETDLRLMLKLRNKSGHKLPTGFPSRRVWIELVAETQDGDILFHSGKLNETGEIQGENDDFEPHHHEISTDDQVQIYEMVMGDQHGAVTTELLRAVTPLKDNRLLPEGFRRSHASYDTVRIVGLVENDPDYQSIDLPAGFYSDHIYYHIRVSNAADQIKIRATVWYQTLPLNWLNDILAHENAKTQRLQGLLEDSKPQPVKLIEQEMNIRTTGIPSASCQSMFQIYPNPTSGRVYLARGSDQPLKLKVYSQQGKLFGNFHLQPSNKSFDLQVLGLDPGLYLLQFDMNGKWYTKKIVLL